MFDKTTGCSKNDHIAPQSMQLVGDVTRYWASLRTGNDAPRRSRIEASAIAHALPDVFLAELLTPRVARLRICGQRIEELLGLDMRGMPLTALFKGRAREEIAEALEQVASGARVTLSLQGERGWGLPGMTAILALLPLSDETGRITRVMGVLERSGEKGRAPRRFILAQPLREAVELPARIPGKPCTFRVVQGGKR